MLRTRRVLIAALALVPAVGVPAAIVSPAKAAGTTTLTLLATGFEAVPTGPMSPAEFAKTLKGSATSQELDDSSVVASSGNKAYRIELDAGKVGTSYGMVDVIPLPRQVDNACVRYRVRFDSTFDWSLGGKLPGLSGVAPGVSPSLPAGGTDVGDKGWSGRMMWRTKDSLPSTYARMADPSMPVSYMYGPAQVDKYGDVLPWGQSFSAGRWHTVRQCYVMNTVGRNNGVLRAWLDGTRVLNRTNYVYRTRRDVHISHLMWSVFRGGSTSSWAGDRTNNIQFDNVRVWTRA
jgi:hypothetical protein